VALKGKTAYIADDTGGLIKMDISQPASPKITDSFNTPGEALKVMIKGDYIYVSDTFSLLILK